MTKTLRIFNVISLAGLVSFALSLSSCMTITNQVQAEVMAAKNYPAASSDLNKAASPSISNTPPMINLKNYQSVETSPERPYQRPDIAVAVAVSGGGYRASNLLMGVLLGLEQYQNPSLKGNLLEEVDYFSTVSGGGFGVGYYLSRLNLFLKNKNDLNKNFPHFSLAQALKQTLSQPAQMGLGSLSNAYTGSGNVLNIDQSGVIELGVDHYDSYEKIINQGVLNAGVGLTPGINSGLVLGQPDFTLGDVFIPTNSSIKPRLPLWIVNTTIYQNMAVMPITPEVLRAYQIDGYRHMGKAVNSVGFNSDIHASFDFNFPYSVALAASSSVPFAMRSTTLNSSACPGGCYLQLFDGGLSDNLGIASAYNVLIQDPAKIKLLIVVDAGSTQPHAFSANATPPGIFSMLWQVMNSGITSSRLLVRNNVGQLGRALMCENGASHVFIVYLDLSQNKDADGIPTSLVLTPAQQASLLKIGQDLVKNNLVLNQDFPKFLKGDNTIGACPAKELPLGAYDVSMLG